MAKVSEGCFGSGRRGGGEQDGFLLDDVVKTAPVTDDDDVDDGDDDNNGGDDDDADDGDLCGWLMSMILLFDSLNASSLSLLHVMSSPIAAAADWCSCWSDDNIDDVLLMASATAARCDAGLLFRLSGFNLWSSESLALSLYEGIILHFLSII